MAFTPKLLQQGASGAGSQYQISRSLRFNSADTTNLNKTFASAGNRRTFTLSFWLKRSRVGVDYEGFFASGNGTDQIRFENVDQLRFSLNSTVSGDFITTQVFRDVTAWYHIVFAVDTTQATSTNRVKIYVNGSQITSFTTSSYPTLNYDCNFNSSVSHRLGIANDTSYPFNGYITETYLIDGQALTPSSFGETNAQTGVWQPKRYTGTYGTNGFYLNFSDNSNTTAATLGKDSSGNGNNWTPNNFSVTAGAGNDSLVDSPTSYGTDTGVGGTVRGNYATLNPLVVFGTSTFTNGNLDVSVSSLNTNNLATIAIPTSGKWYWEYQITSIGGAGSPMGGIASTSLNSPAIFYRSNGDKLVDGTSSAYGATYTTTDIVGVAVDTDGGTITFYKNGSSQGAVTYATSSGSFFPALRSNAATDNFTINFGQRPFAYTAPSGYKALCTQNLPTPTIGATTATLAGKYFNTVLYQGTELARSFTGVGFAPDMLWQKVRTLNYYNWFQSDRVRGANVVLNSDAATAEQSNKGPTSFDSDGWSVSAGPERANENGQNFVTYAWKANGTGSTNTSGSITSQVSANPTAGFSIVTYTGNGTQPSTVGHGLGVVPSFVIVKTRNSSSYDWNCYHISLGNTKYIALNTTAAASSAVSLWNNTTPTSTVFTVNHVAVNTTNNTYVAYCFAPVAGYSAFGSYTGNGNTNRNFVYLGFTPALILVKRSSSSGTNWRIVTPRRVYLTPNTIDAEYASYPGPFLQTSNGFEISAGDDVNENGGTFIYAAFASSPFKYALAQ